VGTVVFHSQNGQKAARFVGLNARGYRVFQGEVERAEQRQLEAGNDVLHAQEQQ
jgi:hypothetical protein